MSKSVRVFRRKKVDPHDDREDDDGDEENADFPDLSTEAIVCEGVVEGEQAKEPATMETIPGYSEIYNTTVTLPPPKVKQPEQPKDLNQQFNEVPVITEDQARQALLEYVSTQCCWGKGAAEKLAFQRLESSTSYHYILESFTESRSTEWKNEPYILQPIDGPENGNAPGPWELPIAPLKLFQDETRRIEVPHTASVVSCHVCAAKGYLICKKCVGRGIMVCGLCREAKGKKVWKINDEGKLVCKTLSRSPCVRCGGAFQYSCQRCGGDGKLVCYECKGHRRLKWFVRLTATWTNRMDEHICERTDLPKSLLTSVHGTIAHQETQPMLWPIFSFSEKEINDASERLLEKHYNQFPNERILMQKQRIRAIPVTLCYYSYNSQNLMYYVYGRETQVHCPDYPDKGSCNIL